MKVLPAIDIKNGNCVRLKKGNFKNVKVYSDSPIEQANHFKNNGFDFIHIVDLDGALNGKRVNIKIIDEIINLGINVQLGGGIRSISEIKNLIDIGVQRVIVSTAAIENDNDAGIDGSNGSSTNCWKYFTNRSWSCIRNEKNKQKRNCGNLFWRWSY